MSMEADAFWLVWSPQGSSPTHRHDTQYGATQEAERLAIKLPGREFYVLQAVALRQVDNMKRVLLIAPIPF
jgi:hypothetical protein